MFISVRSLVAGLAACLLSPAAVGAVPPPHAIATAQAAGWPEVRTWTATGVRSPMWTPDGSTWPLQFAAYPTYEKGVRVAVADVTGDGRAEIVAAPGSDAWTSIEIFDGRTHERLSSLPPWPKGSWWGGADVAAADATGDGRAEVVVGLGPGCCTSFHVWNVLAGSRLGETFPFGNRSDQGAHVAAGDISGDGRAEVLAVPIGGGRIGAHPATGGPSFRSFLPFGEAPGRLAIAAGDLAGDNRAELVAAALTPAGAQVKVLDVVTGATLASLFPFGTAVVTSVEVAVADLDGNGRREVVAAATTSDGTRVAAVGLDGLTLASFYALEPGLAAGGSLAAGDLDGDGKAEIVLGTGPTTAPPPPSPGPDQLVAVFDRRGRELGRFAAFPGRFQEAVHIASGDVVGSSRPELVTAPGPGIAAEIGIYDDRWLPDRDRNRVAAFLAFEPSFLGGAAIALGDLAGDRQLEIVAGAGAGRAAEVRVFDARGRLLTSFLAFGEAYRGGIGVAAGDLDADGRAEIVASSLDPPARIRIFGAGGEPRALLLPATDRAAVEVAVADLDGDGRGELVTGRVGGTEPRLEVLDGAGGARLRSVLSYDAGFTGGIHVAAGDLDFDGRDEVVVGPGNGGDGRIRVYDRRLTQLRSFAPYPWSWPGVFVAVPRSAGLPLVSLPRTVRVPVRARRAFVVASFRDVGRTGERFAASIHWADGASAPAGVRARGGGLYDVVSVRRFGRPGRYVAAVTLAAGARKAVARSSVVAVRSRGA